MKEDMIKGLFAAAGAAVGKVLHMDAYLIAFVALFIIADFVTGLLKGKINGNLNSQAMHRGIIRKSAEILFLIVGFIADNFLAYALAAYEVEFHIGMVFSLFIAAYLTINELISILENLVEMGISVPAWLAKDLRAYRDKMDNGKN